MQIESPRPTTFAMKRFEACHLPLLRGTLSRLLVRCDGESLALSSRTLNVNEVTTSKARVEPSAERPHPFRSYTCSEKLASARAR